MKTKRTLQAIVPSLLISILVPISALAAPSIASISSSTFSHGDTVTIVGSSFGAKTQAAPVLWDTVDNVPSYSSLSDGSTIPSGGTQPWGENPSSAVKMSTKDSQRNGYSAKMYKSTGITGSLGGKKLPNTGQIYLSYWWKPSVDPNGDTHSSKFTRLSNSSDIVNRTFSWTQMQTYVYRTDQGYCQQSGGTYWNSYPGKANQWNLHEVMMDSKSRTFSIIVNGVTMRNGVWTDCTTFDFDYVWQIGWDGGGASPPSITAWMDDIYVDNTFARVVIGNASTFAASSQREIQLPETWSNSAVTFKVNAGAFQVNQQLYLYVVDSTGAVNTNGYPVKIGTVTSTLNAPRNLSIISTN